MEFSLFQQNNDFKDHVPGIVRDQRRQSLKQGLTGSLGINQNCRLRFGALWHDSQDFGYNDISCYRNTIERQSEKPLTCQTPNIDELASYLRHS